MTLQISLSDDSEARLRQYAAAAGKDVPSVVAEAIEEKLAIYGSDGETDSRKLSPEQWIAELRGWAAGHATLTRVADDSRDSIYAGRGE